VGNQGVPSGPQRIRVGRNEYVVAGIDVVGLESARKMNMAAQIVALVSLIFGGVFASSVAVGLAVASYVKFSSIAKQVQQEDVKRALKRVGLVAIVMSAVALVLNAISLVLFMPMVMQIAQTGDYSSLWGGALGAGTGSSNTTWG
ncbi:MAG: hypothetical protein J5818_03225, partial [Eggerthellaceae bacterium]|nr:hypothetical protein [Eggerthellaceae bacterium]